MSSTPAPSIRAATIPARSSPARQGGDRETHITNYPGFSGRGSRNLNMTVRQPALFEVLLMIIFRSPKFLRRNDLSDDRTLEVLLRRIARCLGFRLLLRRMKENNRAVLLPHIRPLAILSRRIVIFPKH